MVYCRILWKKMKDEVIKEPKENVDEEGDNNATKEDESN